MFKTLCLLSVFFSFATLNAISVAHWMPDCQVFRGEDGAMHIWDGNHDYRIEVMIHDLGTCDCVKQKQ